MFYVGNYEVFPEKSELLFEENFQKPIEELWEISNGKWYVADGILYGEYRENAGGLIYTNQQFYGNIMLDFYGMMVGPCNNDLNFSSIILVSMMIIF